MKKQSWGEKKSKKPTKQKTPPTQNTQKQEGGKRNNRKTMEWVWG